jgi:hypothetical protein
VIGVTALRGGCAGDMGVDFLTTQELNCARVLDGS